MPLTWLSPTGGLSVGDFRKVLMKTGLVLVVLGHVSFIAAALLHGTVLRYVVAPRDAVALQYCVVNILSVTSAIVVWPGGEGDWREGAGGGLGWARREPQASGLSSSPCLSCVVYYMGMVALST